ncbi:alkaline phosphatase D family protein [candidate division KSB1 bacterium]|nr:alkaline phosphatase D family protein [candidate division KSB1 bacterium]
MLQLKKRVLFLFLSFLVVLTCDSEKASQSFQADFDTVDRTWIGADFWSVPLEDWQVKNGRLECIGKRSNMRVNVLTAFIKEGEGDVSVSVRMGLFKAGKPATAGLRLGIWDEEDQDVRALCYHGHGLDVGVSSERQLVLGPAKMDLPANFDVTDFTLKVTASSSDNGYDVFLEAKDVNGVFAGLAESEIEDMRGLIALFNSHPDRWEVENLACFWFDDLSLSGSKLQNEPDNAFGPILWSMYTLSRGVMKMTAHMPPIGTNDTQTVQLQLDNDGWQTVAEAPIDSNAFVAVFKIENWDATKDTPYRLVYEDNAGAVSYYTGVIRHDPVDKPLVLGGMTCQFGSGFPYTPLVKNLSTHDPDMLYFSGDQIYESNGGYGIYRFPADLAITNYLGKFYMFGWAFGDLMRNRPTVCTPDDHDVFQGNLWGEGGVNNPIEQWQRLTDSSGGYVQPAEMVEVVHKTQCSHLPDPYDPTPMAQGISVWYTDLIYGRISFAIVSDRIFKSGPQKVAWWPGRADHLKQVLPDPFALDEPGLELLGDRQMEFLENWIRDWRGADMKVLLSQTIFMNAATHHGGEKMVLVADLDSGGWPQTSRNQALDLMRKAFAFHIAGDQHLPTLIQYGIDDFRDGSWAFCTPAIYVGYERRFLPEQVGIDIVNPPEHGLPNTGEFYDGFGNPNYVYAVGNPVDEPRQSPRYDHGQDKSSGYGIITFDQIERTITVEAWHFNIDVTTPHPDNQFPGWPLVLSQFDNDGRAAVAYLPTLKIDGLDNPVFELTNEKTGELEYIVRAKGSTFKPKVFSTDAYTLQVGDPDTQVWKKLEGLKPSRDEKKNILEIQF